MRPVRPRSLLVPVLAAALLAAGCSTAPEEKSVSEPAQGSSAELVEISPVTGQPMPDGRPKNPVFVVKIENTANGAPQVGLDQADLVVEELVEGGLTRLAALYYSRLPGTVGHVRSMRTTDIGIAAPVGGQMVVSGASSAAYHRADRARIPVYSEDRGAPGFRSNPAKSRPYNRLVDLARLNRDAKPPKIPGPYLTWTPASVSATPSADPSAEPSAGPTPRKVGRATVRFSRSTATSWALRGETWQRTNGYADKEFAADTVIVMFCDVVDAGYADAAGNPVPETDVQGSGRAVLLTAEGALETTWRKKSLSAPLRFETKDGTPVTIDPGRTWIELVPNGDGAVDVR